MLTIDALRAYGADVDSGLARCMNNEQFYLMLVQKSLDEPNFEKLYDALAQDDLTAAFEAAHGLKGVLGNLSLTPLFAPMSELTEHLRAKEQMDYADYVDAVKRGREALRALCV